MPYDGTWRNSPREVRRRVMAVAFMLLLAHVRLSMDSRCNATIIGKCYCLESVYRGRSVPEMSVYTECDVSPLKQEVKSDLKHIADRIQACLEAIDNEDFCLLAEFEHIKQSYRKMESRAATFYLNCYLSPFTDKYTDLSVGIRHLSQRRHGALIAVERKDQLEPMIQPGTPIAASVSHSLLESIFYPGSPLHDGAVLIRGNQIVSARNVLPLTRAPLHEQGWGTRHRAAVGLTEQSDAIVLVVSEETGKCSFAAGGVLYPVMST